MRKLGTLLRVMLLLSLTFTMQSCLDDDDDDYKYVDWGTVHYENENFFIESDELGYLSLRDSSLLISYNANREGQRIRMGFDYEKGKGDDQDTYARLYQIEKILTKSAINFTEEMEDSIGNDPINIRQMWLSKNHLNIEYSYKFYNYTIPHMLNLIMMEGYTLDADGLLEVEFRHNRKEDLPISEGYSYISFDLKSIPAFVEGKLKGLKVVWLPNIEEEKRSYVVQFDGEKLN